VLQKQRKGLEALSQLHVNLFCTQKIFHLETIWGRTKKKSAPGLAAGQVLQDDTLSVATVFRQSCDSQALL